MFDRSFLALYRAQLFVAWTLVMIAVSACGGQRVSSPSLSPASSPSAGAPSATASAGCEVAEVPLAFVLSMDPAERLACFGSREIRFTAYYPQSFGAGGCAGDELPGNGWLRPCVIEGIVVYRLPGDADGLAVHLHPDMGISIQTLPVESWLSIQGHFDDSAALSCRKAVNGRQVEDPEFVQACRQEFVATNIRAEE